ncbi:MULTISPECIES: cyclodeaminase/cyclohydrolase family protein [Peptoniphilus]|uniref:cyclodeaminase/cyclohydrolase family protein n=1 Tax=Peptoniphilus TaxID=162289 RepID=UPI0008DADFF5|nr:MULTISPECIES: cyclodeaminase/cyclohydrolase family protein [Peptoniphilus]MBS6610307.1 cyclodeaminase/cyclohydrolase family protein [Peptoniphilus harei]MDU1043666.1 cyclodeaminase/cyclohydrolase family protein [Peptoniphilus rhinitidis]MDU1954507.1 cyclodeaminase/cyclohydrolase family protein [Peptoniphilus lacydonensis]MDU3751408.1 cyclodeaminase/cyclohydrolase family protein [Peptoniphilus rhinitidis]MDU5274996.1 cyclodeaminase/cyclohydrolase family protein [Peptoniphilus lacydonensis]
MLKDLNIVEFADETASNSPAPGGGSIAALNASMAASLLAMVAGLTVGKKKYMDVSERMEELQTELNKYKDEFVEGIDRDANSFNGVMDAMKLPKETDEEKELRSEKIQEGYKAAIEVPLGLGTKVTELYDYARELAEKGNSNAITDVAVALLNIKAAVEGAFLNVIINLNSLKNQDYRRELEEKMDSVRKIVDKNHEEIMKIVDEKLV